MLADRQLSLIVEEAIQDFIYGIRREGNNLRLPAKIPGISELMGEINSRLKSIVLGRPIFRAIHQDDYTSASKFNMNLDNLVDDFTVFIDELISQIYSLGRHFNASEYEIRKIEIQLGKLYHDILGFVESSTSSGGVLYNIGDTFSDRSLVDNSRTTTQVDTVAGMVTIPDINTTKLNMDHYSSSTTPDNFLSLSTNDLMGTKFYNCTDNIDDSYFMVNIKSPDTTDSIEFTMRLNKAGTPEKINEVHISGNEYTCQLYYKNLYATSWTKLCNSAIVGNRYRFMINTGSLINKSSEDHPGITEVRFVLTKDTPDIAGAINDFTYLIDSIGFYRSSNTKKASLYTTTLPMEDWAGGKFTVKEITLDVEDNIPSNCRIEYYIAPDPYASGTLVDASNNPVGVDSTLVDDFEYRGGYLGASGVLHSILRDLDIWDTWVPSWTPITPTSRASIYPYGSGVIPGNKVNMGSYTRYDNVVGWNPTVNDASHGLLANGINLYNIYEFPDDPHDVVLRQGKGTWVSSLEEFKKEIQMEGIGYFITPDSGASYTLSIGPGYQSTTGYITSPGEVVINSINSVSWIGSNIDDPSMHLRTEAQLPEFVADVNISYSNGVAVMTKNPAATWAHPSMQVKLKYSYYETSSKRKFITNIYVPRGATPYIRIDKANQLDKIIVENREGISQNNIVYDGNDMSTNPYIQLPDGWNQVTIYTNGSTTWIPSTGAIPSDLDYYAYLEPLDRVGINELLYRTHRDDHSKMSICPSGGNYALMINDPCTGSGMQLFHQTLSDPDPAINYVTSGIIFVSTSSLGSFYELSYSMIAGTITNVLLRADLYSDGINNPSITSYTIRGGDQLL